MYLFTNIYVGCGGCKVCSVSVLTKRVAVVAKNVCGKLLVERVLAAVVVKVTDYMLLAGFATAAI